jgi:BolA protein
MNYEAWTPPKQGGKKTLDFRIDCAVNPLIRPFFYGHIAPKQHERRAYEIKMSVTGRLREKLMIGLRPIRLDVINESELHAGHRNSPGTGESHFRILVVSEAFQGKSRVERHRLVNELLKEELAGGVHALALSTIAPGEVLPKTA